MSDHHEICQCVETTLVSKLGCCGCSAQYQCGGATISNSNSISETLVMFSLQAICNIYKCTIIASDI